VATATTKLETDGLVVQITHQDSTSTPGTVLSTDPAGNSLVKKGDTVTLHVAQPAPVKKVPVPNGLVGSTTSQAQSILQSDGLTGTVVDKASNSISKGIVISTTPNSGSNVAIGGSVTLYVSSGPANVNVPSLIGLSSVAAGAQLTQAGLQVGSINQVSSNQPAGTVIDQNPGAGTQVAPNTEVNLAVSTGPAATTTTTTSSTTTTTTTPSSSSTPPSSASRP
jgi:serine/threonine-protein kinase